MQTPDWFYRRDRRERKEYRKCIKLLTQFNTLHRFAKLQLQLCVFNFILWLYEFFSLRSLRSLW